MGLCTTTHYSNAQNSAELLTWSRKQAGRMMEFYQGSVYRPVFVYCGMSGVAAATALSLALSQYSFDFMLCYVRKDGEQSHGNRLEVGGMLKNQYEEQAVFCDDFIQKGKTLSHCVDTVCKFGVSTHVWSPNAPMCLMDDTDLRLDAYWSKKCFSNMRPSETSVRFRDFMH